MKKVTNSNKISQIKLQIISKFVISIILAFILSVMLCAMVLVTLKYMWPKGYHILIEGYNENSKYQMMSLLVLVIVFAVNTFWIFMVQMNSITAAIDKLSEGISLISKEDFNQKIVVDQKNELGILAQDINSMAQRLKESREKERKWNEDRYHMITNLSHDLKTPMMSIMGYVDFISEKKYKNEKELEAYCSIVERKTKECNHIVNQLFQLAQISSYEYEIKKCSIGLNEFTEQMLMAYIPQFEKINMEYRINIDKNIVIDVDVDLFKRMYENLISNTIKYASEGKYIDIEAKVRDAGTKIIFRNYGEPIQKEKYEQIFQKFYREKKDFTKEGSGYGLFIVKQIVTLHNGNIHVKSSTECTEFIVEIPNGSMDRTLCIVN